MEKKKVSIIKVANKCDITDVLLLADEIFRESGFDNKAYLNSKMTLKDWSISIILKVDIETVGFYLFSVNSNIKLKGKAIEGVALGIKEEFRDLGLGKMLIQYPYVEFSHYDYIWGASLKSLNNISHWLKRRSLLEEDDNVYITYVYLNRSQV